MTPNDTPPAFDQRVLEQYPYFLSVAYARLLHAESWQERAERLVHLYELGIRLLVLAIIGQYLLRDRERIEDERLNRALDEAFFRQTTFGQWHEILLKAMDAYRYARDAFFIPDIYDFFWTPGSGDEKPQPRHETRVCLEELLWVRNDVLGAKRPDNEEAWQQLYQSAAEHLRMLLQEFSFLERYDLMRITGVQEGQYLYERYTGLEVGHGQAELRADERVDEGNFYIRERATGDMLKLYPLTLSWLLETPLGDVEGAKTEAALYKRLAGELVVYMLPATGEDRPTEKVLDEIVKLQVLVRQAREEWAEAPSLTWELLLEGLAGVTKEQVGEGVEKYDSRLYLERGDVREAFEEFLWGDQQGFVLTGKSGVGKSNFLLALRDVYGDKAGPVGIVMYNGANLHEAENLLERLGIDLGKALGVKTLDRVLERISEIAGIERQRVVLAVDAVNEHAKPVAVMGAINEVVKEATRNPWLKVVITSRPEAWRTIRRELKDRLVQSHYYRRQGEYRLGMELERFTYQESWVTMETFGGGELPQVYAKYQAVYGLRTEYANLTGRMRQVLRDPLMLRLVSQIYQGDQVPADVRVGEIYEDYVSMLVATGRLRMGDVRFLEQEIVPLMVWEGHYGNAVTSEQAALAKTTDGRDLFDLIYEESLGSGGQRVNQGFRNLVDTEILALRGGGQDYRIEFAYERFYEYFVGKRLKALVGEHPEKRVEQYEVLSAETASQPYLWGAVRTAILREEDKTELLRALAEKEDDRLKEMVMDCLVELGKETVKGKGERTIGYEQTMGLVREWMKVHAIDERSGVWRRGLGQTVRLARRVVGARYVDAIHARHLKDIGLEVVYGLAGSVVDRKEIYELLIDAFSEPLFEIRRKATRYLYSLWRLYPGEREDILERVSGRMVLTNLLLNSSYLQAAIDFGLKILFGHYKEKEPLQQLRRATLQTLKRLPDFFITAGVALMPSILYQLLPPENARELANIFKRPDQKQTLLRLGLLLDPDKQATAEDIEIIRAALLKTDSARNLYDKTILPWFSKNALGVYLIRDFNVCRQVLETTFGEAGPVARQWLLAALSSAYTPSFHTAVPYNEVYTLADHLSRAFIADRDRFLASSWYDSGAYPLIHISRLHCEQAATAIPLFCDIFERAQTTKDWALARRLIIELAYAGYVYPLQALESLSELENWEHPEIRQTISDMLAAMRFRYPDLCDQYLERKGVSQMFWDQVRRNRGNPELTKLMDNLETNQFGRDVMQEWPEFRRSFIKLLEQARPLGRFQDFLQLGMRTALNLIEGETPDPDKSKPKQG